MNNIKASGNPDNTSNNNNSYSDALSPELASTYFHLARLGDTQPHDAVKYRQYAWELAQALYKNARTKEGHYRSLSDVDQPNSSVKPLPEGSLVQEEPSNFIGGTLKYLYLTFAPADYLPLDRWVFNRAGQSLPICGHNPMYPRCSFPSEVPDVATRENPFQTMLRKRNLELI